MRAALVLALLLGGCSASQEAPPAPPAPSEPAPEPAPAPGAVPIERSLRTVVIDAGQGGEDLGAQGVSGSYEKDVTLATATKVARELRARGFTVVETRTEDVTVELKRRTELANASGAGLFVSIHANSAPNSGAYGIETYSMDLASDESAIRLAERENRASDLLAAAGATGRRTDEQLVEELRHGANAGWSRALAKEVHRELVGSARSFFGRDAIKDRGQRTGPFWVLLDSEIPSILVELGYLTEAKEEQRIRSHAFQEQAASAIAAGVESWVARAEEAEKGRPVAP